MVGTINGGATGCVGNNHAVAKELCGKFEIRCFTTTTTGAGELKQGFKQLAVLDSICFDFIAGDEGQVEEELPVFNFLFADRHFIAHQNSFVFRVLAVTSGAVFDAETTTNATAT